MKRIVSCTLITALAVSLTLFLTVISGTKTEAASDAEVLRKAKEARYAEELRKAKDAGFIVLSEGTMKFADAVAYCKQLGGRLPRINNSTSWNGEKPAKSGILIEGFGKEGRPWKEVGLPGGGYWAGTADPDDPGYSWVVGGLGGKVDVGTAPQSSGDGRVVCVP